MEKQQILCCDYQQKGKSHSKEEGKDNHYSHLQWRKEDCNHNGEIQQKKEAALATYKRYLEKESLENSSFEVVYIDNNSTPELLLASGDGIEEMHHEFLFGYENGKVVHPENTWGDWITYYKKKAVLMVSYRGYGVRYYSYYSYSGNKAKIKLCEEDSWTDRTSAYYSYDSKGNETKISESTFKKQLKKLVGSTQSKEGKFVDNTESNRKKYLS